ncbi:nucleoside hydrolase [candidate division KSB1 bacterium]|nr:nucleoside hydrolase [candidate division KSB1 bacterium]
MEKEKTNKNLIIDTDVGQDDLMAMAFLLSRSDVKIEAITIANGLAHVEYGARNVLKMLSVAEMDIPVYIGNPVPLMGDREFPKEWRRFSDIMPGVHTEKMLYDVQNDNAVDYLLNRLQGRNKPVRILALGPLTNLAIVYQSSPECFEQVEEIVLMGGAFRVPGNVFDAGEFKSPTDFVEWNIFVDPVAAKIVCESGVKLFFVPLDATNKVPLDWDFLNKFNNADVNVLGEFVGSLLNSSRFMIVEGGYYAWDPLAAAALVKPDVVTVEDFPVNVITTEPHAGQTIIQDDGQYRVRIALDADREKFESEFIRSFTQK